MLALCADPPGGIPHRAEGRHRQRAAGGSTGGPPPPRFSRLIFYWLLRLAAPQAPASLQVLKCSSARLAQGLYTCCSLGLGIPCISFLGLRWHSTDWVAWNNGHASPCLAIVETGSLESRCGPGPALWQLRVGEGSLYGLSRLLVLSGTPWHPLPCRCTTPAACPTSPCVTHTPFLLHSFYVQTSPFYKDTSHIRPTLMTSF